MDHQRLEEIGDELRHLGHQRREVVEQIMAIAVGSEPQAKRLYGDLDEISERVINLLEHQRTMIREELELPG